MTLPPLPLMDDCLFVDNSMLELLTTCPRALQYNKLNQRILAAEKPSLNFGSAIHLALEYRYQTYKNASPDLVFDNEVAQLLSAFFEEHPTPIEDWRNLNWALELLKRYNQKYAVEEFSLLKHEKPIKCTHCDGKGIVIGPEMLGHPSENECLWCKGTGLLEMMVELPFALPLYEHKLESFHEMSYDDAYEQPGAAGYYNKREEGIIKVMYCGKIDLPVLIDNQLFMIDHKTTSMMGREFFDEQRMSPQVKGYSWAWKEIFKTPPFGYLINAIRSKEPPLWVQNKGESNRGRKQTVETWFDESLQRERFYLKDGDLDEWKNNTIELIDEFFWRYSRSYFPMKQKWCAKFGRCPYYDVCSLPIADRELTLASGFFTANTWSPLKQPSQSKQ